MPPSGSPSNMVRALTYRAQEWLADRGVGQYPLPRSSPRRRHPLSVSMRLALGTLSLFGIVVFGMILIAMSVVFAIAIYALVTT